MGSRRDQRILEAKIRNIQYLLPVILSIFNLVTPWHNRTSLSTLRSTTSYAEGRHTHGQSLCLSSQERHNYCLSSQDTACVCVVKRDTGGKPKPAVGWVAWVATWITLVPAPPSRCQQVSGKYRFRSWSCVKRRTAGLSAKLPGWDHWGGRSGCTQVEEVFFSNKLTCYWVHHSAGILHTKYSESSTFEACHNIIDEHCSGYGVGWYRWKWHLRTRLNFL